MMTLCHTETLRQTLGGKDQNAEREKRGRKEGQMDDKMQKKEQSRK